MNLMREVCCLLSNFLYCGENEHFCLSCNILDLNKNSTTFIDFTCFEKGEQILNSNSLSSISKQETFYANENTIFYLCNKTKPKKTIKKRYHMLIALENI